MGLIKAGIGALGGTLADQWKEFFYCEALPNDVLMRKGEKRVSGRSSNTKGNDNIISNGSGIAVADGQCMIIVEQGKIVGVCPSTAATNAAGSRKRAQHPRSSALSAAIPSTTAILADNGGKRYGII